MGVRTWFARGSATSTDEETKTALIGQIKFLQERLEASDREKNYWREKFMMAMGLEVTYPPEELGQIAQGGLRPGPRLEETPEPIGGRVSIFAMRATAERRSREMRDKEKKEAKK